MAGGDVRRLARQGHLDRCWAPGDKRSQLTLPNTEERLVDLPVEKWDAVSKH